MKINLKNIINMPGESLPFEFNLDLSEYDFQGVRPIVEPVLVEGIVRNMAGALILQVAMTTTLHQACDRCTKQYKLEKEVCMESLVAAELEYEESEDEIILLNGDNLDMDDVATTAFILAMDSKNLCSEDCKGFCFGCGASLDTEECTCKPDIDPRLAALAQLLEDKESE